MKITPIEKYGSMAEEMLEDYSDHPCRRKCQPHGKPMLCEYTLHVAWYSTMGRACLYCPNKIADCNKPGCMPGSGTQKGVLVANRGLPGPSIETCLGDRIRVKVMNMAEGGDSTSIHWHGLHQNGTQYMDGIPLVTQCPIDPGTCFEKTLFFYHNLPSLYQVPVSRTISRPIKPERIFGTPTLAFNAATVWLVR